MPNKRLTREERIQQLAKLSSGAKAILMDLSLNWNSVDKFAATGLRITQEQAHVANNRPYVTQARKEYYEQFLLYEPELYTILRSKNPKEIPEVLKAVPDDVLRAFFGIAGNLVVNVKHQAQTR